MNKETKEYILCAAIYINSPEEKKYIHQPRNIKQGFVICGRRHHNCFAVFNALDIPKHHIFKELIQQGFLTNLDRYVDRKEALVIAKKARQYHPNPNNSHDILFSEDLY